MKNIKHFIVCSALLVTTFAADPLQGAIQTIDNVTFTQAGCPCNNRRPVRKPLVPDAEKGIAFELADCPCRSKPPVPVPTPTEDIENDAAFAVACAAHDDRRGTRKGRTSNDDVAIMTVGCGACQNRQNQKRDQNLGQALDQKLNNELNQERAQPKPMPKKQEAEIYGQIAKQAAKNQQFVGGKNASASRSKLNTHERGFNFFKSTTYPAMQHFVRETDAQGSIITIQDGSVWSVKENDQEIVKSWPIHSELTIVPNALSFWNKLTGSRPSHKYRIINLQSNQSVAVNLSLGPFKYNPNTRKIESIDYSRGEVYLNNGHIWKVDLNRTTMQIFRDWQIGQAVICGTNDTWFSLGSPFIIISVEKDNWLPATRVY